QMRRVNCPDCGVKIEQIPWAEGKSHSTKSYQLFLARWARRLSWAEVAEVFKTSWPKVYHSVESVVQYGLKHRTIGAIEAIGVDEVQYEKGHGYMTVVYQIEKDCKRLLYVGKNRTVKSFLKFFKEIGSECAGNIKFVCSDMWQPFLKVIKKKIPQAIHILDRFHIVANLNKALNKVRTEETAELRNQGYVDIHM
ncbi:MAG TPA: ISL3 family transposase, partial [Rhodospirillaceae bacterium]|nr:ISL3 family transposase [Rhodospirillaceae bacterium]